MERSNGKLSFIADILLRYYTDVRLTHEILSQINNLDTISTSVNKANNPKEPRPGFIWIDGI